MGTAEAMLRGRWRASFLELLGMGPRNEGVFLCGEQGIQEVE